jgi:signal transduction histidine kinase
MAAVATTGVEFLAIAGYTLAAHNPRARPVLVSVASALALTAGYLRYWPTLRLEDVAGDLILIAAVSVLPVVFGRAVRRARQTTGELKARNAELVELRGKAAEHAVEAERFRIARELHDVMAHHVSGMTVRARAGHHVAARDPQAATDALAYVADAGTEALTAMGTFVEPCAERLRVPTTALPSLVCTTSPRCWSRSVAPVWSCTRMSAPLRARSPPGSG